MAGTISGWQEALAISDCWNGQLSLPRLLEEAIYYAENGIPVTASQQRLTQSKRPELRDQAVLLHHPTARGQHVAGCSPAARALGVDEGMSVAEATSLVRGKQKQRGCTASFHSEPYNPEADCLALRKLAAWSHRYSPSVGLAEDEPPDTLLLDVTGIAPLFGSEQVLIEQVAKGFTRLHLTVQVAIADTVGAAWALAHYGWRRVGTPLGEALPRDR